jgi:phenylacetate-CoA ligase
MLTFRTALTGVVWPAIVPAPGANLLSLLFQLEQSQWLTPAVLAERQFEQLGVLAEFLWQNSAFYRERLAAAGWNPGQRLDETHWLSLPVLKRATVQSCYDQMLVKNAPKEHGRAIPYSTTGSLGMPVQGLGNELTHLFNSALIVRNHLWHRRDLSGKFVAIRCKVESNAFPDWGRIESSAFVTGPAAVLFSSTDIDRQLDWVRAEAPTYLLTYPSNLRSLLLHARERAISVPSLRELSTFGEMLPDEVRSLALEVWQQPVSDVYSSEEFGNIALQCPEHADRYHVQAENLLVEIVDEHDVPCAPGEIGRVLVSTLHNFTMPLLRYEIGDYAEAGASCACGRGLPVIRRIAGRQRNMLRLPDGRSHWPSFSYKGLKPIADFRQIQIIQHQLQDIEVRLAGIAPLSREAEALFSVKLCEMLHGQIPIRYSYPATIAPSAGGKFEDFLSLVKDSG